MEIEYACRTLHAWGPEAQLPACESTGFLASRCTEHWEREGGHTCAQAVVCGVSLLLPRLLRPAAPLPPHLLHARSDVAPLPLAACHTHDMFSATR